MQINLMFGGVIAVKETPKRNEEEIWDLMCNFSY